MIKHVVKIPNRKMYEHASNTLYIYLKNHEQAVIGGLNIDKASGYLSLYHAKLIYPKPQIVWTSLTNLTGVVHTNLYDSYCNSIWEINYTYLAYFFTSKKKKE